MKRTLIAIIAILTATGALAGSKQFISPIYTIDKIYHSMEGPSSMQRIYLGDPAAPAELLWITGIRTEMVDADGKTPQLPELMCHVNVDLDPARHQAIFGFRRPTASRLMTLSQGMITAKLPEGYGFPMSSNEPLLLFTQVLNLNIEHPQNLKVRHRVTVDFVRASELTGVMKPLFNVGASGMVLLDDNPLAMQHSMMAMPSASDMTSGISTEAKHSSMSCLVGARAPQASSGSADYVDPQGHKMTGHWIVPPGKQVNHSDITWFMNLQFDTKLHYAAAHLHPFAKSLEIRDMTTGKTVFLAKAENPPTGIGLTHVDDYASADGVLMDHTHKYSLISTYDNPTNANADSMASAFLGMDDPEIVVPTSDQIAHTSAALFDNNTLVLHTNIGNITATLDRDMAPETVIQIARFVLGGALNATHILGHKNSVSIAMPAGKIRPLLQPLRAEAGVPQKYGTVSYCQVGAFYSEPTILIAIDNSRPPDSHCTGFAKVSKGLNLLGTFTPGTSASLVKAETVGEAKTLAAK